jgi:hypothetical protein
VRDQEEEAGNWPVDRSRGTESLSSILHCNAGAAIYIEREYIKIHLQFMCLLIVYSTSLSKK